MPPLLPIPSRRWPPSGEHIVAQKTIYGGTSNLLAHTLPLYGIESTFVDAHNLTEVEGAIQDNTKAIYIETLGNPNSDIPDIDAIAQIAHKHGLPLVIDNTFGTPYLIRPIEHGADVVVHSATKFIGGHGTTLGGVIVDGGTFDWAKSGRYPWISEPNPSYHGVKLHRGRRPRRLRHLYPCHPAARHWRLHLPLRRVPPVAGC